MNIVDGEDWPQDHADRECFEGSGLYCETVIKTRKKLIVPDALADDHWKDNPDIKLTMVLISGCFRYGEIMNGKCA